MTDPMPASELSDRSKAIESMRTEVTALKASSNDPNLDSLFVDDLGETEAIIWNDFHKLPKEVVDENQYEAWMSFSDRVRALQGQIKNVDVTIKRTASEQEIPGNRRAESIARLYAYIQGSIAKITKPFVEKQMEAMKKGRS